MPTDWNPARCAAAAPQMIDTVAPSTTAHSSSTWMPRLHPTTANASADRGLSLAVHPPLVGREHQCPS